MTKTFRDVLTERHQRYEEAEEARDLAIDVLNEREQNGLLEMNAYSINQRLAAAQVLALFQIADWVGALSDE